MGFFRWFKNSSKMKRWILLILVGIVLVAYGMVKAITGEMQEFSSLALIIASFVGGFVCIIIGIVYIQKRTLELLVQETDSRDEAKEGKVKSLIFNKKIYNEGPKVVVIGGGSGLNSVVKGLKKYTSNITAIVTVSDYGEPTTLSRKELEALPLDDIKSSFVALSDNEDAMQKILEYKFEDGKLRGLNFGDIFLLGMTKKFGDLSKAVEGSKNVLNITGKVLPVTLEPIQICAELTDGTEIDERNKIGEIVADRLSRISRVFIKPTSAVPAPGVIEAIEQADAIIIGPGNLYTNVIPNLLVRGISKAIKESKAFKIYIANLMTEPEQTDNYTLSDHIKAIIDHVGQGVIDYCFYDTGEVLPDYIKKYNIKGQDLVEADPDKVKGLGVKLIQRNMSMIEEDHIKHNPDVLASSVIQLVVEDMRFNDMQNDYKYVALDNKLKNSKKIIRKFKKDKNKALRERKRKDKSERFTGKGKFASKYGDRIQAIQESDDEKAKQKRDMLVKAINDTDKYDGPEEGILLKEEHIDKSNNDKREEIEKVEKAEEKKAKKESKKTLEVKINEGKSNRIAELKKRMTRAEKEAEFEKNRARRLLREREEKNKGQ